MTTNVFTFLKAHTLGVINELRTQLVTARFWKDIFVVFLGVAFYAIGFSYLIFPQRITTGGLTGFCNLFTLAFGIDIATPYMLINYGLLVLTFFFLGKNFFVKTLFGVFLISTIIDVTTHWAVPDQANIEMFKLMVLQDQPVMALAIGSIMTGLGLGMVFSVNGCTGGTDIVVALINRYTNMSLGRLFLYVDGSVVLMSFFVNAYLAQHTLPVTEAFNKLVLSILQVVIVSQTLDWYIRNNRQSVQIMVFSAKYGEINEAITKRLHRGCTILHGQGGYTGQEAKVLVIVARMRQSVEITRIIEQIDPKAFITLGQVKGVYGEGFESMNKKSS
ncbi:MAG: YitT family protein [Porphyromonas sp.]|nr:YitT family protein [Porphyromonas sp.]